MTEQQQQEETFHCPTCGKDICALSATVHRATCGTRHRRHHHHTQQQQQQQQDDHHRLTTDTTITTTREQQRQQTQDNDHSFLIRRQEEEEEAPQQASSPAAQGVASLEPRPPHDWACPQCTLLNDVTRMHCEACGYVNTTTTSTTRQQAQPTTNNMRVEVREINPRTVAAATTAMSIVSWTALGGLIAGPIGAAVGGLGATLLAATQSSRQQPTFSFTSTTVTRAGDVTTTRYVTTDNQSGRRGPRTVVLVRSVPPGSAASDRLLRRMLLLQGLHQAAVDDMDYEQLVEQFRAMGNNQRDRGASAETIAALPCTHLPDDQAAAKWSEKPCNICLEDFAAHQDLRQLPACGHAFHKECIDEWLQRVASCPICKTDIRSGDDATATSQTNTSNDAGTTPQEASSSHHPQHHLGDDTFTSDVVLD